MADEPDSDDRTEEPTQRKLDEAIKRGDVAKSQEINTLFVLGGFTLAPAMLSGSITQALTVNLRAFLMNAHQVPPDGAAFAAVGRQALGRLSPRRDFRPSSSRSAASSAADQHRPLWTFEPLTPKFNRISPMSGAKRIYGKEAWVQFLKGLLKIAIAGGVASTVLWNERDWLELRPDSARAVPGAARPRAQASRPACWRSTPSGPRRRGLSAHGLAQAPAHVEAGIEGGIQEHRRQSGDQGQAEADAGGAAKKRMMAAVPTATVVITNPTHYAVALKYERGMPAPDPRRKASTRSRRRSAPGQRSIGSRSSRILRLARALHATVQIDQEIPVEHYKAVAEVIGAILRLRRRPS